MSMGIDTIFKVGGGVGDKCTQSMRKFLPYYIQNLKICNQQFAARISRF